MSNKTYKDIERECHDLQEGTCLYTQALMNPDTEYRAKQYWDVFVLNIKRLIAAYDPLNQTFYDPSGKKCAIKRHEVDDE